MVLPSPFVHFANPDGTIDSFCRECCVRVITAMWEFDLDRAEEEHRCDPARMEYLNALANDRRSNKAPAARP
jgi:hypothetical protein